MMNESDVLKDEILVFLDSNLAHSTQSASNKTFRVNPQIMINQDEICYVNLTDFHMLNSLYNINDTNNSLTFNGTFHEVTPGFYTPSELADLLTVAYPDLTVVFNTKTLKYKLTATATIFVTGTLLTLLGITDNTPASSISSQRIPDELTSKKNILFTIANLNTKNQMTGANNIPSLIDKIPVDVNFSEYISYINYTNKRTRVLSDVINDLTVRLLAIDLQELDINDISWTATLKFSIYKKAGNHFMETNLTSEDFKPVVHSLNSREFINQREHDLEGFRDRFWIPKFQKDAPGRKVKAVFNANDPNSQFSQHNNIAIMTMDSPSNTTQAPIQKRDRTTEPQQPISNKSSKYLTQ